MSEDKQYYYRSCFNHYHVYGVFGDLVGGRCDTEEEAKEKTKRLNEGESTDAVLGTFLENVFKELPWLAKNENK